MPSTYLPSANNKCLSMRVSLQKNLCLLHTVADAQRHHHLQLHVCLIPHTITRSIIKCLLAAGLALHYYPKKINPQKKPLQMFCFILRYWEGQPLVLIAATPGLVCSHQSLKRRFKHGLGVTFLLWNSGKVVTNDYCLLNRCGGRVCATLVA